MTVWIIINLFLAALNIICVFFLNGGWWNWAAAGINLFAGGFILGLKAND